MDAVHVLVVVEKFAQVAKSRKSARSVSQCYPPLQILSKNILAERAADKKQYAAAYGSLQHEIELLSSLVRKPIQ